jgi:hypothetical protein
MVIVGNDGLDTGSSFLQFDFDEKLGNLWISSLPTKNPALD